MRLNRFLAACGLASRRSAEVLILDGRVAVNGAVVHDLATFVEPGKDRVTVDGKAVSPPTGFTYYLLHKPEGFVTTASDPEGRATVLDLVPPRPRVFPVGRLDQETSGALLLTDDGPLAHRILHPRYGVEKEYTAVVEGLVQEETLESLRRGVHLPGERHPTAPARVEVIEVRPRRTRLRVIVHEGRKRQVRRMLETVGHPVLQLRRERVGPVSLGTLPPGIYRPLTPDEIAGLRRETARARRMPSRRPSARGDTPHGSRPSSRPGARTGARSGAPSPARSGVRSGARSDARSGAPSGARTTARPRPGRPTRRPKRSS